MSLPTWVFAERIKVTLRMIDEEIARGQEANAARVASLMQLARADAASIVAGRTIWPCPDDDEKGPARPALRLVQGGKGR
jgi:hypothetical protein